MPRTSFKPSTAIRRFMRREDGVATVDWVILLSGATGLAIAALNWGQGTLTPYSATVRGELQDPHFDTSWTQTVDLDRPEDERPDLIPPVAPPSEPVEPDPEPVDEMPQIPVDETSDDDDDDDDDDNDGTGDGDGDDGDDAAQDDDDNGDGGGNGDGPVVLASLIEGCPDPEFTGQSVTRTAEQLSQQDLLVPVTAGGLTRLNECSDIAASIAPTQTVGFNFANPHFSVDISGLDGFNELEIEARGNGCDTTLLVRNDAGDYFFDNNDGPGRRPRLKFLARDFDLTQFNGRLDIYVGSVSGQDCDITIEIDAFL